MLKDLISKLEKVKQLNSEDVVQEFESILAEIDELNTPECIKELCAFFVDDTDYDEIMFSIIHLIEKFDDKIYIQEIFRSIARLISDSPYWCSVLHFRIMNVESTFNEYLKQLTSLDINTREVLKKFIIDFKKTEPEFTDKVSKILELI